MSVSVEADRYDAFSGSRATIRTNVFETRNRVGRSFDELFQSELPWLLSCLLKIF
jgi:hypothetical protein